MDKLMEDAKKAINKVFGNTSVSKKETIENLSELANDIEIMIDALKSEEQEIKE